MDIRPIRTDQDYRWALAEVEPYFDNVPDEGTPEADRFDVLTELISAYEAKNHPVEPLGPVEFIETTWKKRACGNRILRRSWGRNPGHPNF